MIVRHQRESTANKGFRHIARYIRGRGAKSRATWFHAANLPGVLGTDDLELACALVEAVQARNTRAGSKRTYHLVVSLHPDDRRLEQKELQHVVDRLVDTLGFSEHQYIAVRHNDKDHEHIHVAITKIHPETFRIHSPAWDHQKLFTGARALERQLGLTPLRSRTRDRERVPHRAADCEAVDSMVGSIADINALSGSRLRRHNICTAKFGASLEPDGLTDRQTNAAWAFCLHLKGPETT